MTSVIYGVISMSLSVNVCISWFGSLAGQTNSFGGDRERVGAEPLSRLVTHVRMPRRDRNISPYDRILTQKQEIGIEQI